MAGAACLICLVCTSNIGSPIGQKNEPIGCCHACHSLVCGHHGHRDPSRPAFLCLLCVPSLVAATAAASVQPTTDTLGQLREVFEQNQDFIPLDWLETDEPQSLVKWSRHKDILARVDTTQLAVRESASADLKNTIGILNGSPRGRKLLTLAYLLVHEHEISTFELTTPFRRIVDAIALGF